MVLSKTFAFLHNLIPACLTDEDRARELFIDRNIEASYLKDVKFSLALSVSNLRAHPSLKSTCLTKFYAFASAF